MSQERDMYLCGYSDADWSGDWDEHKSTLGYAFLLIGVAISWLSKKKSCIALSTMESNYTACAKAAHETVWPERFLHILGMVSYGIDLVVIHCDSMATLS